MERSMYAGRVCEEHIGQEMTFERRLAVVDLRSRSLSTFVTVRESCSWLKRGARKRRTHSHGNTSR